MAAIEPMGSAMTYQAQQIQPVKQNQANNPESMNREVMQGNENGSTVNFDPTTAKIVEAQETDTKGQNNQPSGQQEATQQREATSEQIKKAVESFNKRVNNSEAVFGFHEGTNRVTIKLVDKETKEVIKELPPEKTLDMIAKVISEEYEGLMVDEKK